jgi:hypothetical protein
MNPSKSLQTVIAGIILPATGLLSYPAVATIPEAYGV